MYDIKKIQDDLLKMIGWQNTLNKCETKIDPILQESESGLYYNFTHALLDLENLGAITPSSLSYEYPIFDMTETYAAGAIVRFVDNFYESLVDANYQNAPTDTDFWKIRYPFSEWIERQTRQSINTVFNSVVVSKKVQQKTKSLLSDSTVFRATTRTTKEQKNGRLVGFKIEIAPFKNLKLTIDKIGLRFSNIVTDLPIKIYHSSIEEPIFETTVSTSNNGSFSWQKLETPFSIEYWSELYNTGGAFYLVYDENDLPTNCLAINDMYDSVNGVCGSCPSMRDERIAWERWRRFVKITTVAFSDFQENILGTNLKTYGLNLSFSIRCDITDIVLKNKTVFTNAIIKQVQHDFINYMLNSNRTCELSNRLRKQAAIELNKEGGELKKYLAKEIDAIDFDLSDLDTPCCPAKDERRVKYGSA